MRAWQRTFRVPFTATVGLALSLAVLHGGDAAAQSAGAVRWNRGAATAATPAAHDSAGIDAERAAAPGAESASSADVQGELGRHRTVWTIRLNEEYSPDITFVDFGEIGVDNPGDYSVFRDPVTDPRTGARRGNIVVHCLNAYATQCRGTITLAGRGQIVFDGVTPSEVDPDRYAITGGTGDFRGATGVLVVSFPDDNSARLTIQLELD